MPCVLLTRPQKDSEELARHLKTRGYETVIEPMLVIKPVVAVPPDFRNLQAVMVTSRNALDVLNRTMCVNAGIFDLECFCVGSRTAAAAKAFGFQKVNNADGDGLALAGRMAAKLDPGKGDILHIAGHDTDSRGGRELENSGFGVRAWEVYIAEAAKAFSAPAVQSLRDARLDAVLVFSVRTAETLRALLQKSQTEACCQSITAIGISDAVLSVLEGLPWRGLAAAPRPTEEAVLQRLQELIPVSEVS